MSLCLELIVIALLGISNTDRDRVMHQGYYTRMLIPALVKIRKRKHYNIQILGMQQYK